MKARRYIILGVLILAMAAGGYYAFFAKKVKVEPNDITQVVLVSDDAIKVYTYPNIDYDWMVQGGYLPHTVMEYYNIYMDYDSANGIFMISDGKTWIQYDMTYDTAIKDGKPFQMTRPEIKEDEVWFVGSELSKIFHIEFDGARESKSLFIKKESESYQLSELDEKGNLYAEPELIDSNVEKSNTEPVKLRVYDILKKGETVIVSEAKDDEMVQIMTADYQVGWISQSALGEIRVNAEPVKQENPQADKVFLTWEVYGQGYDTSKIGEMAGVNVISPAWYDLKEGGAFTSKASEVYTEWAKSEGYKIWALVTNDFNLDLTHDLLHNAVTRQKFIDALLSEYKRMGYDGVNIDFENVYKDDKRQLTQFVAELSAKFRQAGLTVTMDVTVMGGSDNWSKCFDRKALGSVLDYMAVMTYDEHWASSPVSGSVASYDWVKRSMERILEDVPGEKLLLGIPYYMYVWTEVPSTEKANTMRVKSGVLNMPNAENWIEEKSLNLIWDESARQYYAGYIEDGALKKIWFENGVSIKEKASLVNELGLAGAAVWRRGFETQDIWSIIDKQMNGR